MSNHNENCATLHNSIDECDCDKGKIESLRAKVRELEQKLKQYKNLRQILRKRILDYQTASIDCSNNRLARSRYEGIATGTRWAAEDMEEADRI